MKQNPQAVRLRAAFRRAGGVLRTAQALRAGVHPRDLYALRDAGVLEQVSRGVYRLADLPPFAEPDLVTVALRVPKAVIALVSALHFHGLTTEIPHEVSVALPQGTSRPRLDWPPLRVYWLSGAMFTSGIEAAVEALRTGIEERKITPAELLRAARTCRVARIMRPYLEALSA